jgi:hypothetical protein
MPWAKCALELREKKSVRTLQATRSGRSTCWLFSIKGNTLAIYLPVRVAKRWKHARKSVFGVEREIHRISNDQRRGYREVE